MFDFLKKYQKRKNEIEELKELRSSLDYTEKSKMIDKLLESEKIDKFILKFQNIYQKISRQLFIRFDLKNEIKQGKIFTILITLLILIYLIFITIFFGIMLNSLIGLNLLFTLLKYSLFSIKWGYTILKKKGSLITRYLSNLFPNSKVLHEENKIKIKGLPVFETVILKDIENLTDEVSNMNLDINILKEIILELKDIVNSLELSEESFKEEIKSLEYKKEIIGKLEIVKNKLNNYQNLKRKEDTLKKVKQEMLNKLEIDTLNESKDTIMVKKLEYENHSLNIKK